MAAPALAFPHSAGDGRIMFHSTEPLAQDAALRVAAAAWAALQDTPLGAPDHQIDIFVTGGRGWRHWLFFRPAPWAGGLTYPFLSQRNVFLREVDLEAGQLLWAGEPVSDPRDLTYYLVHEITHLRHAAVAGRLSMVMTPRWIREGVPDVAALGLADGDLITRAMAGDELGRDSFGSYPSERVCVTLVLARPGMDMAGLLALRSGMHAPTNCPALPIPDSD
ncbi:MAG: hypothetical protein JKY00_07100 [Roseicyclus sp.]|nr:hypothetical protein [Roseicyclus sp.]